MRLAVLALLAACSSGEPTKLPAKGSGSGSGSATRDAGVATMDVCGFGLTTLAGATCPSEDIRQRLMSARRSFDGVLATVAKVTDADPRQFQVMCAQMLFALERDAIEADCKVEIPAVQRAEIQKLLDAWYAQRTKVTPTGDAAADAVIARIVAVRDAACACKDAACLELVDQQFVAITPLSQTAPLNAKNLAKQLLDDIGRCIQRVRSQP